MKSFRDLMVGGRHMRLLWPAIEVLRTFPNKRSMASLPRFADVQLRLRPILPRDAVSAAIPSFQRYLHIAAGSASELEYHFGLAKDLGFLSDEEYKKLDQSAVEVKRMLAGLVKKVEADRRATDY